MFYPMVELSAGRAVLWDGGAFVEEASDPVALVARLQRTGDVLVLDRDAAQGKARNRELLMALCRRFDCVVGGGVRSGQDLDQLLRAGALRVLVGPGLAEEDVTAFPRQRLVLAVDRRPEPLRIEEWAATEDREFGAELGRIYSAVLLASQVSKVEPLYDLKTRTNLPVWALGTAASAQDVQDLDRQGVLCVLDGAFRRHVDAVELFADLLDFEGTGGLVPTILQDTASQVLGLYYSNRQAVAQSLREGTVKVWSMARGVVADRETVDGQPIRLVKALPDCRRRALLYRVQAPGPTCHTGSYSCFGERELSLETLEEVILSRRNKRDGQSYTQKVLASSEGVAAQLLEQARQLVAAQDRNQIIWEAADLLYFMLVHLARQGVRLGDVLREIRGRAGRRRL